MRLAEHDVRCRLYADRLRFCVKQRKESTAQRQKRLEVVARLTHERERDTRAMQTEQRDLQGHLEDLIARHGQSNKYIQDLARELREALAQVSVLAGDTGALSHVSLSDPAYPS